MDRVQGNHVVRRKTGFAKDPRHLEQGPPCDHGLVDNHGQSAQSCSACDAASFTEAQAVLRA